MAADDHHMTPDEFRRRGTELIEWIATYMENIEDYPVLSRVEPGDVRAGLADHPPQSGEPFDQVIKDFEAVVMPGITHWQAPGFYAYFSGNTSAPAILADLLAAGIGVQGMMWLTSPAATELEVHVTDWMVEMLGLPDSFSSRSTGGGVIQDTASTSSLLAAVAGRERALAYQGLDQGVSTGLTAYTSEHAHSSIEKAIRVAGIGSRNLRLIETDETFSMKPDALRAAIEADVAAGLTPAFVNATVGTTSTLGMDPVRAIGEICREHGVWYHVDAAWAGTAAVCPEFRHYQDGLELADSYVVNPHKWMLVGMDCSCLFVADREALTRTMTMVPEYLRNEASESGAVVDYRDWGVALGRRFRSLKLWFVIRHYGIEGLQRLIRDHVAMAKEFAGWVDGHDDFELAAPVPLTLVCFRHVGGDEVNQAIMDEVSRSGEAFFTHTKLDGQLTLRLAIGQTYTERRHVRRVWELIRQAATGK